jgi:hypothetical protein
MEHTSIERLVREQYHVNFKQEDLECVKEDKDFKHYTYRVLWKKYPIRYDKKKFCYIRTDAEGYPEYDYTGCEDQFA